MNKLMFTFAALLAPAAFAEPLPQPADLLATNTVVAVYEKTIDRPCMHLTSLCPDRCDHAKKLATFRVVTNENYKRPGKYGDDKAERGSVLYIDVLNDEPGQDPSVRKLVSELNPGDAVRFTVDHYYVKEPHAHYPVRPVTKIERVAKPDNVPAPAAEPSAVPMPLQGRACPTPSKNRAIQPR